jgi:hypothetical protein
MVFGRMDSTYCSPAIREKSCTLDGSKAEVAVEEKRQRRAVYQLAENVRCYKHTTAERPSPPKDEIGGTICQCTGV